MEHTIQIIYLILILSLFSDSVPNTHRQKLCPFCVLCFLTLLFVGLTFSYVRHFLIFSFYFLYAWLSFPLLISCLCATNVNFHSSLAFLSSAVIYLFHLSFSVNSVGFSYYLLSFSPVLHIKDPVTLSWVISLYFLGSNWENKMSQYL